MSRLFRNASKSSSEQLTVFAPGANLDDLFEEPKTVKARSPTSCPESVVSQDSSFGLKRTRSLGLFSARSKSGELNKKAPTKIDNAMERRSLNAKAANLLGVDLEGNVVKSGRKRFSLHRRSFSAAYLF